MRFDVINGNPDYYFMPSNLERMLKGIMIGDSNDLENRFYQPLTEIRENEKEYQVRLQLPGIKKEDIDVEIEGNSLVIQAEHKFKEAKDDEKIHSSQFCYGKFMKTLDLGKDIDSNNTNCEFKDGILNITLAKINNKKENKKLSIK